VGAGGVSLGAAANIHGKKDLVCGGTPGVGLGLRVVSRKARAYWFPTKKTARLLRRTSKWEQQTNNKQTNKQQNTNRRM
jgi:hypothetical protein